MGMLKINVIDASGAALPGQTVKVSGAGALQTNAQGMVQFLITDTAECDIAIGDTSCWAGASAQLAREEVFEQSAEGFKRLKAA